MKYDFIENKVKDLVRDLQWAERDACCEDDYQRLTDIAEDIIGGIPRNLLLIDYWTRYAIANRLPEGMQRDKKIINETMEYLYNNDTVCFDSNLIEDIDDDIDTVAGKHGGQYGLQEQTKDKRP